MTKKCIFKKAVCLVCVLSVVFTMFIMPATVQAAATDNLIGNGTFDQDTEGWRSVWSDAGSVGYEQTLGRTNPGSIRLLTTKNCALFAPALERIPSLTEGSYYVAKAYVKVKSEVQFKRKMAFVSYSSDNNRWYWLANDGSGYMMSTANDSGFIDANNNIGKYTTVVSQGNQTQYPDEWTEVSNIFYAHENAKKTVGLSYGAWSEAADILVDDVSFVEVVPEVKINGFKSKMTPGESVTFTNDGVGVTYTTLAKSNTENIRLTADDSATTLSLKENYSGVTFENNTLTISNDTTVDEVVVVSKSERITREHTIAIDKPTAPEVSNVKLNGKAVVGEKLTVTFDTFDLNDDVVTPEIKWYRSDKNDALNVSADTLLTTDVNSAEYTITADDVGKYIWAQVTPTTEAEPTTGTPVAVVSSKVANELVDLILVSGQSNSYVYDWNEDGMETDADVYVFNFKTEDALGNNQSTYDFDNTQIVHNKDFTHDIGITIPIGIEWNKLNNGKKTVLINTGRPGKGISYFLNEGNASPEGYNNTKKAYRACLKAIENKGWYVDKKITFWLQGEGNSTTRPADYSSYFNQLLNEWQADDVCGKQDLFGVLINRSFIMNDQSDNAEWDKYISGPRSVFYSLDSDVSDNVELVSCATDSWLTNDGVKSYFEQKYPEADAFKSEFGYDRPTTTVQVLCADPNNSWNGHYWKAGYNEMGVDAAENAYKLLNASDKATEIKVLDNKGNEVTDGNKVKLSGKQVNLPVYVYPMGAKSTGNVVMQENEYFDFDAATGVLKQKKDAPTSEVDVTFTAGDLSKTITVEALTSDTPIKYNWTIESDKNYKYSDTSKGGVFNQINKRGDDNTTTAADGCIGLNNNLSVMDKVNLPCDKEWTVRMKGQLRGQYGTWSSIYYDARFFSFGDDLSVAKNVLSLYAGEYGAYVSVRNDSGKEISKAEFSKLKEWNTVDVSDVADTKFVNLRKFERIMADKQHVFEFKNVKQSDGTFKFYFCLDGEAIEFNKPLGADLNVTAFAGPYTFTAMDYIEVAVNYGTEKTMSGSINGNNITVTEVNKTDKSVDRVLFAASYDKENMLKEIVKLAETEPLEFVSNVEYTGTFTKDLAETDKVKVFMWDNMENIVPILPEATLK